jgi:molecular chaperone GrpE
MADKKKSSKEETEIQKVEIKEEVKEENQNDIPETIEDMASELEKLKEENKKYYEHLQRTAAEFENYKKRVTKEKDNIYTLAVGDVVSKYIPTLDNIEKALNIESIDEKVKEGLELIHRQIIETMKIFNVIEIATVGETFNPEVHDAVMHVENEEYGEKTVIEELRKGYRMGERVIRHAMVKVAN